MASIPTYGNPIGLFLGHLPTVAIAMAVTPLLIGVAFRWSWLAGDAQTTRDIGAAAFLAIAGAFIGVAWGLVSIPLAIGLPSSIVNTGIHIIVGIGCAYLGFRIEQTGWPVTGLTLTAAWPAQFWIMAAAVAASVTDNQTKHGYLVEPRYIWLAFFGMVALSVLPTIMAVLRRP